MEKNGLPNPQHASRGNHCFSLVKDNTIALQRQHLSTSARHKTSGECTTQCTTQRATQRATQCLSVPLSAATGSTSLIKEWPRSMDDCCDCIAIRVNTTRVQSLVCATAFRQSQRHSQHHLQYYLQKSLLSKYPHLLPSELYAIFCSIRFICHCLIPLSCR